MVRQQQAFASYCIACLSNSWYFYEIAAPIRAEMSVFHVSLLFHNTYFSYIYLFIYLSISISIYVYTYNLSPNAVYILGWEVKNIVKSRNCIKKNGWKAIGDAVRELQRTKHVVCLFQTRIVCNKNESLDEHQVGRNPLHLWPSQRKWFAAVRLYGEKYSMRRQ